MDFFEILKVIFLGIVEGITEWLPVSSTGHMIILEEVLDVEAIYGLISFAFLPNSPDKYIFTKEEEGFS